MLSVMIASFSKHPGVKSYQRHLVNWVKRNVPFSLNREEFDVSLPKCQFSCTLIRELTAVEFEQLCERHLIFAAFVAGSRQQLLLKKGRLSSD